MLDSIMVSEIRAVGLLDVGQVDKDGALLLACRNAVKHVNERILIVASITTPEPSKHQHFEETIRLSDEPLGPPKARPERKSCLTSKTSSGDTDVPLRLFFKNKKQREQGRPGATAVADEDPYKRLFGTAQPADIPESSEWWKRQQRDLFAMSDDGELGLMQTMTTVT